MGQTRYPELDRSTQLPTIQGSKTSRTKKLDHRVIKHAKFRQTEQGVDTIDVHEQGSSFWGGLFSRNLRGILCMSRTALSPLGSILCADLKLGEEPNIF